MLGHQVDLVSHVGALIAVPRILERQDQLSEFVHEVPGNLKSKGNLNILNRTQPSRKVYTYVVSVLILGELDAADRTLGAEDQLFGLRQSLFSLDSYQFCVHEKLVQL